MPLFPILDRWTDEPIVSLRTLSLRHALKTLARNRISLVSADLSRFQLDGCLLPNVDLRGANLRGVNLSRSLLSGADLRGADLRGACLNYCLLRSTDLRGADLRGASFDGADLQNASLVGADLRQTNFAGSKLTRTKCDWKWGVLAAELLQRDPSYPLLGVALVLDLNVIEHSQPFEWIRLLTDYPKAKEWALATLLRAIQPNDNSSLLFRHLNVN